MNGWTKALKYNPNIFVRKKIQKMANCVLPWIQLLSSCYRCCWRPELKMFSRFVDKPMNWYTADKLCRRHGGQLVEIDSLEEQKALVKESRSRKYWRTKKQFWMGLTDRKVPDDKQFHSSSYLYLFRKAKPLLLNHIVIITRKREGQWVLESSGKGPSFTNWKGYRNFL